jgi:hypothetical protein
MLPSILEWVGLADVADLNAERKRGKGSQLVDMYGVGSSCFLLYGVDYV